MNRDQIQGKWHQLKAVRATLGLLVLVALVAVSACRSTQPVSTQVDDNVITSKVKAKLVADPQVNPFDVSVTTNEGIVTLSGRVKEPHQRAEAEKLAWDTEGVKGVNNMIKVGELAPQ
jgi:osmotically-inducible protein OsmY